MQAACVGAADAVDEAFDRVVQASVRRFMAQQARAHHRRQGQRDEARDQHRPREREREFDEQLAGAPGRERHRRIDGHEGQRHRDHRETDFLHADEGCLARRHAVFDVAINVFEHDDGVVDHQTDREHQREQGQRVDREPQRIHQGASADQRNRNRHQRHDGRAQIAQEKQNHQGHQHHGLEDRRIHVLDRLVDEDGLVVRDAHFHAGRQILADARQFVLERVGDVERIGSRLLDHAQRDRGHAVEAYRGPIVERIDAHARQIVDAHIAAVDVAHHDVAEFLLGLQIGLGDHIEFALAAFDAARRNLDVLAPDRIFDILGRQTERSEPVAIEIDAHRVLAFAADLHIGHAGQGLQTRLDDAVGVIRNRERRYRLAREREPDDGIGVGLDLGDHRLVDVVGQTRAHARHPVAHIGRRTIDIARELEAHRDLARFIARSRGQGLDAFDARERILERLGDLAFDDLGRSAAVIGADIDHRLVDLRIFAHRQTRVRHRANQRDDERQHGRKHRTADAQIRQTHERAPLRTCTVMPSSRSLICPAVTTRSPADRPRLISTTASRRKPSSTSVRTARVWPPVSTTR